MAMPCFCYILECADGTYYTGWTTDPERRLAVHNKGRGARYTPTRLSAKLVYIEPQDFVVYTPNASDMIIVAKKEGTLAGNVPALFSNPRMAEALSGVHIRGPQDIEARKVGNKNMLMPLFDLYSLPMNSDYDPVLSQNAARARFLGSNALELLRLAGEPLPVVEMLSGTARADGAATSVTRSPFHPKTEAVHTATGLRDFFLRRPNDLDGPYRTYAEQVAAMFSRCGGAGDPDRRKALFDAAKNSIPYLTPAESAAIWKQLESRGCQAGFTAVEQSYVALFKAIEARTALPIDAVLRQLQQLRTSSSGGNAAPHNFRTSMTASGFILE